MTDETLKVEQLLQQLKVCLAQTHDLLGEDAVPPLKIGCTQFAIRQCIRLIDEASLRPPPADWDVATREAIETAVLNAAHRARLRPQDDLESISKLGADIILSDIIRAAIVEECARVADRHATWSLNRTNNKQNIGNRYANQNAREIAKGIRALANGQGEK